MTETVDVWFGGVHQEYEAYVLNTDDGVNIEFVDAPIVLDYNEYKQND